MGFEKINLSHDYPMVRLSLLMIGILKITSIFALFASSFLGYAGDMNSGSVRRLKIAVGQQVVNRVVTDSVSGRCQGFWSCKGDAQRLRVQLDYRFDLDGLNRPNLIMRPARLVELVQMPEVSSFLFQLKGERNLWEYTLSSTHGDESLALERIAILFQDISKSDPQVEPPQVTYLKSREMRFEADLLVQAINVVRSLPPSRIYPSEIYESDAALYHFYVNAYLSKQMQLDPLARREAAVVSPFLFNLSYEAVKYGWLEKAPKSVDWDGLWNLFKKLFVNRDLLYRKIHKIDPENKKDRRGLVGTWAGLAGSAWITGHGMPTLDTFVSEFSSDPNLWIETFLRQ